MLYLVQLGVILQENLHSNNGKIHCVDFIMNRLVDLKKNKSLGIKLL